MIFLTVGTQLPFDRLIKSVDRWAETSSEKIIAQTLNTSVVCQHIDSTSMLPPLQARSLFKSASLVVSHAGMGSILTALELTKPIIIFPRRASLKEHRNDHQMATARKFSGKGSGVYVAYDEEELWSLLNRRNELIPLAEFSSHASEDLIKNLQRIIRF